MMKISIKNKSFDRHELMHIVSDYFNNHSRFTCETIPVGKTIVKIANIRLRENRKYCGSHPNACEFGRGPSRSLKYLEGSDWVEVNDTVNDIMDALGVDANISTSVCIVRKNLKRRNFYGSHMVGFNWQWNYDEEDDCFENHVGNSYASNSEYPFGTPGLYERHNEWTKQIRKLHETYSQSRELVS